MDILIWLSPKISTVIQIFFLLLVFESIMSFPQQLNNAKYTIFIFGYTRRLHAHMDYIPIYSVIPNVIIRVISKHVGYKQCTQQVINKYDILLKQQIKFDKWDENSLHLSDKIDEENKYILGKSYINSAINPFSFGKQIIYKKVSNIDVVIWKLKLIRPQLKYIGIVEANDDKATNNDSTWCHLNNNSYILCTDGIMYNNGKWDSFKKINNTCIGNKKNQIIYLLCDFEKGSLWIKCDKSDFMQLTEKINKKIKYKLAIGLGQHGKVELLTSLQC